ncbi:GNAT family N-acetyltransferase [Tumebacillus sp. DT12]|uniref:GNAT family N-acetyltransferase n=1 Tax=Tumebacillus lacus TaxID=2995335 RepID=A0ABT3X648_9BACL|nr:GNAT family N-acetyltransferase [Tumebacillus lacus]MCX7572375.1 GNAT family N-acetyltransferase [Tumebacillus lacus]
MEYIRVQHIDDPLFAKLHKLMGEVFPAEEVLEYSLWKEPLEDPDIYVYVAVHEGEVVGITEYRYYKTFNVAMTDFTIVGREGLGLGRFLQQKRQEHLFALAKENGKELFGMFAEIYDPYRVGDYEFGGVKVMNPVVRREVLSHLGFMRLDLDYVHPSWQMNGEAVSGLDLGFLPYDGTTTALPTDLVVDFLTTYYAILPDKPKEWLEMVEKLKAQEQVALLPL